MQQESCFKKFKDNIRIILTTEPISIFSEVCDWMIILIIFFAAFILFIADKFWNCMFYNLVGFFGTPFAIWSFVYFIKYLFDKNWVNMLLSLKIIIGGLIMPVFLFTSLFLGYIVNFIVPYDDFFMTRIMNRDKKIDNDVDKFSGNGYGLILILCILVIIFYILRYLLYCIFCSARLRDNSNQQDMSREVL